MYGLCFKSEHRGWQQDQWSWVCSNFGITDICELDSEHDGERGNDGSIYQPTIKVDSIAECPSDRPIVVMAPADGRFVQGTESLDTFVHPDDAIYVFGGSQDNLNPEEDFGGRSPEHLVFIPFVKHESYSHSAAYVTFWDRRIKRGDFG